MAAGRGHRRTKVVPSDLRRSDQSRQQRPPSYCPFAFWCTTGPRTCSAICPPKKNSCIPLNLQRLKKVEVLEDKAEIPSDFRPELLEKSAFSGFIKARSKSGTCCASLPRSRCTYARGSATRTKSSQSCRTVVQLSFTCGASWEVSAWVASWRHWVDVLEPTSLRAELRDLGACSPAAIHPAKRPNPAQESAGRAASVRPDLGLDGAATSCTPHQRHPQYRDTPLLAPWSSRAAASYAGKVREG